MAHPRQTRSRREFDILSRRAFRAAIGPAALTCLALLAVAVLVFRTSALDLFDLIPNGAGSEGYSLLAWYDLERGSHSLKEGAIASGTRLRALGYMTESDQVVHDGQPVTRFVLLPDKGNAFRPAHRLGDQMIDVRLRTGDRVVFAWGSMVWVWGILQTLPGDPGGHVPLYRLDGAHTAPASEAEISKYFHW